MWTFEIVVILTMIAVNGLFAGYEIALAAVSLARLRVLEQELRPGAAAAVYMKENIAASLAVIQLGITLFGAIAAATGGAGAEESLAPMLEARIGLSSSVAEFIAIALVVCPLTIVSVVFGELIPKVFALKNQEWMCLMLSPVMHGISTLTRPVVLLLESSVTGFVSWVQGLRGIASGDTVHHEPVELRELQAAAQLARASRLIGGQQEAIIQNAAQLSRRRVRDIMLPVTHINMLNADDSLTDCLIAAHLYLHTRFPVTERSGDPQCIIGYVNFKDIVALLRLSPNQVSLRAILHPIPSLSAKETVAGSLEIMMRDHTHIALIRGDSQQVIGMITLEDVLEELVGEIHDEHDRLAAHVIRSGQGWVVGGGVPLARLREVAGIVLPPPADGGSAPTLSAWISRRLGRPPVGGDVLECEGLRIAVRKIRHTHLLEAQVTPSEKPPEPSNPTVGAGA